MNFGLWTLDFELWTLNFGIVKFKVEIAKYEVRSWLLRSSQNPSPDGSWILQREFADP
jgi:hypothetical protein